MTDQQIAKWIDQLQGELDVLKRTAGGGSSELTNLSDVSITNPADADIISYDDQNEKWVNMEPTTNMLQDVQITSPQDGQLLVYNAANEKWINRRSYQISDYTDTERLVGKWGADDLYERTLTTALSLGTGTLTQIVGASKILVVEAYVNNSTTDSYLPLNYFHATADIAMIYSRGDSVLYNIGNTTASYYDSLIVKIRYTKQQNTISKTKKGGNK